MFELPRPLVFAAFACFFTSLFFQKAEGQVTTQGFLNLSRGESPGTLLSHPVANGSEPIGRTTSINYVNGWIIVGAEAPGSRPGSDLVLRVYDITDPTNPIRRFPSDFGLSYPNNRWYQGNYGWGAHGTAQKDSMLLPGVLRVSSFGAPVELGGTNGIPDLGQVPVLYNRSSQAGPWYATKSWYGPAADVFEIYQPFLRESGYTDERLLAQFDHVGPFGGGDWHPMFFGDLLIYARSGGSGSDGVVVYRMQYHNFDDPDRSNRSVTPQFVASMDQGFEGYWPTLFSDGTGLFVIGSSSNILIGADVTQAADPDGDGSVSLAASMVVPGFSNATYPVFQDQFGFIHDRKIDISRFLAGDSNPVVLTLDEDGTGVDTSQMSLVLGNLWLTGGYPVPGFDQGMGVWVHQQAPDTTAPRVSYHIPQVNRTNYPRHAPLSFLLHEHPRNGGIKNGVDFTVRRVNGDGSYEPHEEGFLIHDFSGVLTFTPNEGLDPDSTYQVDFLSDPQNEVGFYDAAGNIIEPYSYRFSTSAAIDASAPPSITEVTADNYHPAPGETFTVSIAATGSTPLEYRFNFDGTWSDWNVSSSASHAYANEGRPQILVQVRDTSGALATDAFRPLVIQPSPGPYPTQSSTMAVGDDPAGRRLWVVNPDADTVSVLDPVSGAKLSEHPVGSNPRNIARDGNGRYWVSCHLSDEILVLNPDGTTHTAISLDFGAAPFGVCASPDGEQIFVTLYGSGHLQRYQADAPSASPVTQSTFATPRAIAVSGNGERVLVTRFISPDQEGLVGEFAGTQPALDSVRTFTLKCAIQGDGGDRASGVPNYLTGIAISPDGTRASVVSKQDNIQRGLFYGVPDLTHETTVRAVVSFLDLDANEEILNLRKDFDNSDSPSAVAYTPMGDTVLVALQGNNRVVGIDTLSLTPTTGVTAGASTESTPAVLRVDMGAGLAPQGLLLDTVSGRLFIQNFMSRSVTMRDADSLISQNRSSVPLIAETGTVAVESLTAEVLEGKQIFYNAADPRMSGDSYISCATCHIDGGHDGQVWDFHGRGEGLRRTTDLRGRSGVGHGNVHWSGNFDEIQDFEHDIRGPFGGTGFLSLTPQEFAQFHASPASGKTGLSSELDALSAYVSSLGNEMVPRSPHRESNGNYTAAALRGQALFTAEGCVACHSGDSLTMSPLGPAAAQSLSNVGSLSEISGQRLGQTLAGIDIPTLHGIHASPRLLHNGQVEILENVFDYAGGVLINSSESIDLFELDANAVQTFEVDASLGGGGFLRGAIYGDTKGIREDHGSSQLPGIRFENIDGGSGGNARISIRYVSHYAGGNVTVRVNGIDHNEIILRQQPDDGWMASGWRWLTFDSVLNPGTDNVIDVSRVDRSYDVSAIVVANAEVLAMAAPHRRVNNLSQGDRDDLLAYLSQLDGRDETGVPLADPQPPGPSAPSVVVPPMDQTVAEGNDVSFFVSVSGTGPFSYEWFRDGASLGNDSPSLTVSNVSGSDSGAYTVRVTNSEGNDLSVAGFLTVNPPISITTTALPETTVYTDYSVGIAASGGISEQTWSLESGHLPEGMALSSNGVLSGQAAAPAVVRFTVRVEDQSGFDVQELELRIEPFGGFENDPDLILHYTFDEGQGDMIWDSSANGNDHSTSVPGAIWSVGGRRKGAYGPEDADSSVFPFYPENQSDLNFDPESDEFTFSVWVRTVHGNGYNTIFAKDDGPPNWDIQYRLWKPTGNGLLQPIVGDRYHLLLDISHDPIDDGEWHLLTMVNFFDETWNEWRVRLYYDDGTVYGDGQTGSFTTNAQFRIGDTSHGGNSWFGQIDDFRVFTRALTQAEVRELYYSESFSFSDWLEQNLTPQEQADPFLNQPGSDHDGNGLSNLLEFTLTEADPEAVERQNPLTISQTPQLQLEANINRRITGAEVVIESSPDLETWSPMLRSFNGGAFSGSDPFTETIDGDERQLTIPRTPGSSEFYRLRAISLP